jgi:predicted Ser/Thr protein kinase
VAEGATAPLWPGDPASIGPYRLVGRLGAGGMGAVYLAEAADGQRVAVKVIRPELAADPEFLARFRHEVQAAWRVAASCTARVLGADVSGPRPYLVTEYIEGISLDKAIARDGPLPTSSLEGLAVGVAAALTGIHATGLVHRDLKPSNVLLSRFGPRVIDFGIARALDATSALTQIGTVVGTPGWMAPEQIVSHQVTAAADVFCWGALVAYAGTGRHPFGEGSPDTLSARILHAQPDLGALDGHVRAQVEAALAKDPARRPTARGILLDLLGGSPTDPQAAATAAVQRTWVAPAAPPGGWPAARQVRPRRRWWRRKRVLIPLALLLLLVLGDRIEEARRQAPATMGAPAQDGAFSFVVTGLSCGQPVLGQTEAQGQFCVVDLQVSNVGDEARTLDLGAQELLDDEGNVYSPDAGAAFGLDNALGLWTQINPGNDVAGAIVYDVPEDRPPARMELHDSPFSRGVLVDLAPQ